MISWVVFCFVAIAWPVASGRDAEIEALRSEMKAFKVKVESRAQQQIAELQKEIEELKAERGSGTT